MNIDKIELERRKKISKTAKKNGLSGGLRIGSGRGKKGWYKGYWCDSSWELAWVIYNLDHSISFERNTVGFSYIFKNETHKYYPDFIKGNTYYEIKGYVTNQFREKINQFKGELIILKENDLKQELEYVKKIYGNNFLYLYDNSPHVKYCISCKKNLLCKGNKSGLCKECFKPKQPIFPLEYKRIKKIKKCYSCGKQIERIKKTGLCAECYLPTRINTRKVERPIYDVLIKEVNDLGYYQIGKKYKVSDNSIRKWVKFYEKQMKNGKQMDIGNG